MPQFINPGAWWLAALFAILVALYLWQRARRQVEVPSLLLWRAIPESAARASRFRPDWLFVLQCALLALLIAGLADPYFDDHPGLSAPTRTVFVLDLSASMQAREGRETRFDLARSALRERVLALGNDDEAMLVAAAHQPQIAVPFTRDHAALLRRLAELTPVDTAAPLDVALALAQRAAGGDPPAQIELFSDAARQQIALPWRETVAVFPFGETDDNLAIEGVQVFQGRFQDHREAHAFVAVRNFARRETHGILTMQMDDAVFSRRGFSLAPRSVGGFPLPALPGSGLLRASLEVDDALAVDNRVVAWVRAQRPLRVRVVSDTPGLGRELQRIARATPSLVIDLVAPDAYAGAAGADVVLFHRVAPPLPDDAASLYVFPSDDGPFTRRDPVGPLRAVDWNAQHPALHGLRPELPFAFARVQDVVLPPWADTLLSARHHGTDVPLVFAGERGGHRHAAMTFDLEADSLLGADHVNLLLLFLNLLEWLAPAEEAVQIVHTGDVAVIDNLPALPRRIVDPHQHETILPADRTATIDTPYAGEYRVAADGTSARIFANFIDPHESDIGRSPQAAFLPPPPARGTAPQLPRAGFAAWLYAVAAALLVLEWFAARRMA